jgi:hypothetical protein
LAGDGYGCAYAGPAATESASSTDAAATVDDGVVLRRDGRHLCWQGEHQVEVLRVENLGPAILQPLRAGQ